MGGLGYRSQPQSANKLAEVELLRRNPAMIPCLVTNGAIKKEAIYDGGKFRRDRIKGSSPKGRGGGNEAIVERNRR